jgi:hypothetical protein
MSDVQPSDLTHVQLSPATTPQAQLAADISIQHSPCNQELAHPLVNTVGLVEEEEEGEEGEGEQNREEVEEENDGEGVEEEEGGEIGEEKENEQVIEGEEEGQEDNNHDEGNDKA